MWLKSQLIARKKQKELGFEACLGFMVNLSQKKKRKIFELLAISVKMENPTPLCFPTECNWITCGLEGPWRQAREKSGLKKNWVAVSSVPCCDLCHVLRGAGSWGSPWVWKEGAPKAGLLLIRGAGRGAPAERVCGGVHLSVLVSVLSLPNPKCEINSSGGNRQGVVSDPEEHGSSIWLLVADLRGELLLPFLYHQLTRPSRQTRQ